MVKRRHTKPMQPCTLYETFPQFLEGIGNTFQAAPALSWFNRRKEEQSYTYGELQARVYALREVLCNKGLCNGVHIAVVGENSADWLVAFLAAAA